jgi:hypothetical protein
VSFIGCQAPDDDPWRNRWRHPRRTWPHETEYAEEVRGSRRLNRAQRGLRRLLRPDGTIILPVGCHPTRFVPGDDPGDDDDDWDEATERFVAEVARHQVAQLNPQQPV